jgi:acyl-CoA synthetase (AMP-forming)/AMP-acid ligase II
MTALDDIAARGARRAPDRPAIVVPGGGALSYAELERAGSVDARGQVTLAGRSKDLILRAGANVYPAEVESVLLRHPQVAEAYVIGVHHAILGEAVAACVVRRAQATVSERELIQHCRAFLAPYKCPETVRFVDAVPKTSRGKVSRTALQALVASP